GRSPALLAGGVDDRSRTARDPAVQLCEAVRSRHLHGGHDRRRPDLRGLRVHEGVPGREADAGRQAVPDLRGHLADPAARDRQRIVDAARLGGSGIPPEPPTRVAPMPLEIDLTGRVALVTGGPRRLGPADALTLARRGAAA